MADQRTAADQLLELHQQTDRRFAAAVDALPVAPGCGSGCFSCCVDELTVWQPEADRIAAHIRSNREFVVHPRGSCAMLRDGRCQVYPVRPYVCRSQGAVLRFWDSEGEVRDTCPEHLRQIKLDALPDKALFDLGPAEQQLAGIASQALAESGGKGLPERVRLRDLAETLAAKVYSDEA